MVPAPDFDRLMSDDSFRAFVFSLISKQMLGVMQLVQEVAFHRLDRRLASLLAAQKTPLYLSHKEIADELGTVREMVTRVLNAFCDDNLIRLGRARIDILDRQALEDIGR